MTRESYAGPSIEYETRRGARGFSLVELLIALTIFSIGMLAVATLQTTALRGNAKSGNLTRALKTEIQDRIEQLLAFNYTAPALAQGAHGPVVSGIYSTSWNVQLNVPVFGAKTVTVTCAWSDLSGNHGLSSSFVKSGSIQ